MNIVQTIRRGAAILRDHAAGDELDRAADAVDALLSQAAMATPVWQPIDTTPRDKEVLVAYRGPAEDRYVAVAYWFSGEWVISFDVERVKPYAWMPLPEPPK